VLLEVEYCVLRDNSKPIFRIICFIDMHESLFSLQYAFLLGVGGLSRSKAEKPLMKKHKFSLSLGGDSLSYLIFPRIFLLLFPRCMKVPFVALTQLAAETSRRRDSCNCSCGFFYGGE
jgi:hypothetical protein